MIIQLCIYYGCIKRVQCVTGIRNKPQQKQSGGISALIPIWNSLPEELVNCNSITTFRTKLDNNDHYK